MVEFNEMTVDELREYAEANGIEVDKRCGKKKLIEAITGESPKESTAVKYKNINSTVVYMFGKPVKQNIIYEPTKAEQMEANGMARIDRGIKLGLIEKV